MTRFRHLMMLAVIALSVTILTAVSASALTWTETGDAGDLAGAAQEVSGSGAVTSISGGLAGVDADLYRIFISNPASFGATTVNGVTGSLDTHLYLFNASGQGVYANEDTYGTGVGSTLPVGDPNGPTVAGVYYVGIAQYGNDGYDVGNVMIFPDSPFWGTHAAQTVNPLHHWQQFLSVSGGAYRIDLTGAEAIPSAPPPTGTPEPTTLALMGVGLAAFARRRRSR